MATATAPSQVGKSTGIASLPKALPWWGWLIGVGVLLWASAGTFHTAIVLVLVAALVYQFSAISHL